MSDNLIPIQDAFKPANSWVSVLLDSLPDSGSFNGVLGRFHMGLAGWMKYNLSIGNGH